MKLLDHLNADGWTIQEQSDVATTKATKGRFHLDILLGGGQTTLSVWSDDYTKPTAICLWAVQFTSAPVPTIITVLKSLPT